MLDCSILLETLDLTVGKNGTSLWARYKLAGSLFGRIVAWLSLCVIGGEGRLSVNRESTGIREFNMIEVTEGCGPDSGGVFEEGCC